MTWCKCPVWSFGKCFNLLILRNENDTCIWFERLLLLKYFTKADYWELKTRKIREENVSITVLLFQDKRTFRLTRKSDKCSFSVNSDKKTSTENGNFLNFTTSFVIVANLLLFDCKIWNTILVKNSQNSPKNFVENQICIVAVKWLINAC